MEDIKLFLVYTMWGRTFKDSLGYIETKEVAEEAVNDIINDTPYETYDVLFDEIFSKRSFALVNPFACYKALSSDKPFATYFNKQFPLLAMLLTLLFLQEYVWFLPIVAFVFFYILNYITTFFPQHISKTLFVSLFLLALNMFFFKYTLLNSFCISIIAGMTIKKFLWDFIFIKTIQEMRNDKRIFLWMYWEGTLKIIDSNGKIYKSTVGNY